MASGGSRRGDVERLGVWEVSEEGSWADFCASVALLLGHEISPEECTLERVKALAHPEDRPQLDDLVADVEAAERRDVETRWRAKSPAGRWHHLLSRARVHDGSRVYMGVHLDLTEIVETHSALQRREQDFRLVVENANEGIGILDERQVIHFANRQFAEILGMRSNDLLGRALAEFVEERDRDLLAAQIKRRRSGKRSRYELRMIHSDGSLRWVRISGSPLFDAEGEFRGSFALMTDVTANHEQQRRLRDSERRLADIVEFLPDPTMVVDRQGRLVAWNRAIEELTGVPSEELMGRGDYAYAVPFYGEARPLLLNFLLDPDIVYEGQYAYLDADGDTFVAEAHVPGLREGGADLWIKARRLTDAEGKVFGAIETIRDVTERRRVEGRLRESEQRYRALFESAVDAIFVMRGTCFIDGNRQTEKMFGASREQLLERTPFSLSPPLQPDGERSEVKGRRHIEAALDGETQVFHWVHEKLDGTPFDAEVTLTRVVFDEQDHVLAFVRDISERREAEREQERLERQLRHSQKMEAVGQLAGGVAHDFNNLLQAISGYTELVENDLGADHSARANVAEISRAAERAAALTRQLLTFSRRDELHQEPLHIDTLVAELAKLLRRLIGEHIELSLAPGPRVSPVLADRGQIEQVVLNLCVNARDAMPEGGRVEIETRDVELDKDFCESYPGLDPGTHVMLRVSDNGPGIPEDVRERMFEPFFTTKDVGEGTGLGLATAYAIAERHGGAIVCESKIDEGSTFRVYVPVVEESVVAAREERRRRLDVGGSETILVAEDEPAVRSLAETVLRGAGYRVLSAEDGAEAMRLIDDRGSEIDLALLDIVMPRRGGPQVAARLLAERPDVPIIFSSGYAFGLAHARDLPGESLAKPYRPSELLERIREALDRARNG